MSRAHDPRNDTRRARRKLAPAVAVVLAVVLAAGFASLAAWPPINDVTTGETPEYPELQPRAYAFSRPRVVAAAVEAVGALRRFDLVSVDEDAGVVEATARTRSGLFTDDVTVRVEANGEAGSIVFVRSRSRVGRGDLGQNARNIRALQEAMDASLFGE